MSNMYYKARYECERDCTYGGCPGHEAVLHVANTSDTYNLSVDGESRFTVGENLWQTILRLAEQRPVDSFWPEK